MPSNAWSHRRERIPRPPVCKSRSPDEQQNGVNAKLLGFWSWGNPTNGSQWSGQQQLAKVPFTNVYLASVTDNYGNQLAITAIVNQLPGNVSTLISTVSGAAHPWISTTIVPGWPTGLPWTSAPGVVQNNNGQYAGDIQIELSGIV